MALWWLSFLRPLPVAANSHVEFIIQIADDLRTKLYLDPIDVYYIWSSSSLDHSADPVKLTTWRPEHAHKLLRVASPLAPNGTTGLAAAAITWRLGLFTVSPATSPSRDMMNISLNQHNLLNDILPVYSAPIPFNQSLAATNHTSSKRGKAQPVKIQKQDEIQRLYALASSGNAQIEKQSDPWDVVTIIEKTSFDLDKRAWDSGVVLAFAFARWISNYPHQIQSDPIDHSLAYDNVPTGELKSTLDVLVQPGCKILELGAGCGVVSVILATLLDRFHTTVKPDSSSLPQTQIHATDLPSAVPLITRNCNCRLPSPGHESSEEPHVSAVETSVYTLDWEDEELPVIVTSNPPDIIMMSDVTYNTASFPALLKTTKNLLHISPAARVIIAYKERHPDERIAWKMFDSDAKLSLHKVEEIPGAAGAPVEIWIGTRRTSEAHLPKISQ